MDAHTLEGVRMYGPAMGVFGNTTALNFQNNGQVQIQEMVMSDEYPFETSWEEETGFYHFSERDYRNIISITKADGSISEFEIRKEHNRPYSQGQWVLLPLNKENPNAHIDGYVDYPSECEA